MRVEQTQTSAQKLSQPLVANASDTISNIVLNQQNIVTLFDAIMKKLEVLIKVGDEVAKGLPLCISSLVARAELIILELSDIYLFNQMVQAQQARDLKILDLVRTMENTYSFVSSADELKNHTVLQDIAEQILKQTIECGYFIQGYMRRSFGGTW